MTGWFPLSLGADVDAANPAPVRLAGEEIVLWRDADGTVLAWEDRCPHRGMRLSFGFLRAGRLACLYHGWQFGTDGACRHIPAHPTLRVPGTIRVSTFSAAERCGLVWVNRDPQADASALPADVPMLPARSLSIEAEAVQVQALLGLGSRNWARQDGRLVALHAPEPGVTMLHVSVAEAPDRPAAAAWARAVRERIEAGQDVPA